MLVAVSAIFSKFTIKIINFNCI